MAVQNEPPSEATDGYLRLVRSLSSQDMLPHIALCCLEGSTLSNLVHQRRRCARIVLHSILCLEGSTPQDRSGADTQTAPVGRCMCGIPYSGCRFALPWAKCLLPFQGAYLGRTIHRTCCFTLRSAAWRAVRQRTGCLFLFIALRWM